MTQQFTALPSLTLRPGSGHAEPPEQPFQVLLNSPATDVMTDFQRVSPVTVSPGMPIDEALDKMRLAGVRLLLVVNPDRQVIGLITATDIHGEKPINMIQEQQIRRTEISVDQIMTPQAEIDALSMQTVRSAQVGHVLATLDQLQRQHMLVVDLDPDSGEHHVRGLFSSSQIHRQMAGRTDAARLRSSAA